MQRYYLEKDIDPATRIPDTYLIPLVENSILESRKQCIARFKKAYEKDKEEQGIAEEKEEGGMWIYKPGESTNQGNGIKLFNQFAKIQEEIKNDVDR